MDVNRAKETFEPNSKPLLILIPYPNCAEEKFLQIRYDETFKHYRYEYSILDLNNPHYGTCTCHSDYDIFKNRLYDMEFYGIKEPPSTFKICDSWFKLTKLLELQLRKADEICAVLPGSAIDGEDSPDPSLSSEHEIDIEVAGKYLMWEKEMQSLARKFKVMV
ncbi:MAG: hypothetical protein LQ352_005981 [Teloschistes flavicans]|nr:MAG: hypothetical protein LQ352_005981 [Teloschistes flavicans]